MQGHPEGPAFLLRQLRCRTLAVDRPAHGIQLARPSFAAIDANRIASEPNRVAVAA